MQEGQLIAGRYRLVRVIGAGGMGEVWLAVDQAEGTLVALKIAGTGPDTGRGVRAMEAATRLGHPNIVGLLDTVRDGNVQWLVMEYVRSASLDKIIAKSPNQGVRQVAALGAQMASALAAVHAEGVVHRDVKPGNILIAPDGSAKLADFGISRVSWGDPTVTNSGQVGGTPAYMGAEVANGDDPTTASDVFSLGATLFAAIEDEPIYGLEQNPLKTLRKAARMQIGEPRRAGPLTPLISAMLAPEPADRPTAAQAAQALAEVANGSALPSVPAALLGPDGLPERTPEWWPSWLTRRRSRMVGVAAVAVAVVVVLLAVFVSGVGRHSLPVKPVAGRDPSPSGSAAAKPATVGDPRTADPCALLKTSDPTFTKYGRVELSAADANFNRCDVLVHTSAADPIDVQVILDLPQSSPPEGAQATKTGPITGL
ncbi:serine/threonine-protein kinase [Fodinicola feengrottensis]|uniref:serine/threonine-protein kinase n=1 Tax=Fodinicola feengrottensis TaxID=435914 RepID=UPI0013D64138|nr:serine/threonine-protein kinase [Fodinicola feengrottensis]